VTTLTGTVSGGSAASLQADDTSYLSVRSPFFGRTTSWYGSFTGVPSSLSALSITFKGKASTTSTQTVYVYNFRTAVWESLSSRTVGTVDVLFAGLVPGGALADYVNTSGQVRVRVTATTTASTWSLTTQGNLMSIQYTTP
jgi:hypothetical protein